MLNILLIIFVYALGVITGELLYFSVIRKPFQKWLRNRYGTREAPQK